MENKFIVYMHKFPNGKMYIGITSLSPNQRWRKGKGYSKYHQSAIYRAIKKYGWNNIEHIILFKGLSEEEAKQKEIELIKEYNTYIHSENSNGYNMTLGGEGSLGHKNVENISLKNRNRMLGRKGDQCPNSYPVICDGIRYSSISEFCEVNNLNKGMVEKWLRGKSHMPKEWLDKDLRRENGEDLRIKTPQFRKCSEEVYYDGKIYKSQVELSKELRIKPSTLCNWLSGKTKVPQDILNKGLGRVNSNIDVNMIESDFDSNCNEIEYDGNIYKTQVELAKFLNIKNGTLNSWLRGKNKMPQEYKDKGLKYHNK